MIRTSRHHTCAVTPRGAWPPRPHVLGDQDSRGATAFTSYFTGQVRLGTRLAPEGPEVKKYGTCRSPSEQRLLQQVGVVPHDQAPAHAARRRTQLPGAPQHVPEQLFVGRAGGGQVVPDDLPALGDPQLVDAVEQGQGVVPFDGIGVRALERSVVDPVRREKLPRLVAALSARAVVPPVQRVGHVVSSCARDVDDSRATLTRRSTPAGFARSVPSAYRWLHRHRPNLERHPCVIPDLRPDDTAAASRRH